MSTKSISLKDVHLGLAFLLMCAGACKMLPQRGAYKSFPEDIPPTTTPESQQKEQDASYGWSGFEIQDFQALCVDKFASALKFQDPSSQCHCLRTHLAKEFTYSQFIRQQTIMLTIIKEQAWGETCTQSKIDPWTDTQASIAVQSCKGEFKEVHYLSDSEAQSLCECCIDHMRKDNTYRNFLAKRSKIFESFMQGQAFLACGEGLSIPPFTKTELFSLAKTQDLAIATNQQHFKVLAPQDSPTGVITTNGREVWLTNLKLEDAGTLKVTPKVSLFRLGEERPNDVIIGFDAIVRDQQLLVAIGVETNNETNELWLAQTQASNVIVRRIDEHNSGAGIDADFTLPTSAIHQAAQPLIVPLDDQNAVIIYKQRLLGSRPRLVYHQIQATKVGQANFLPQSEGVMEFSTFPGVDELFIAFNSIDQSLFHYSGWLGTIPKSGHVPESTMIEREGAFNPLVGLGGDAPPLYLFRSTNQGLGHDYLFSTYQDSTKGLWNTKAKLRDVKNIITFPMLQIASSGNGIAVWIESFENEYFQLMAAFWQHSNKRFSESLRLLRSNHELIKVGLTTSRQSKGLIYWQSASNLEHKEFAINSIAWDVDAQRISRQITATSSNSQMGALQNVVSIHGAYFFVPTSDGNNLRVIQGSW